MSKRNERRTIRTHVRAGATEDQIRAAANQVQSDRLRGSIAAADAVRSAL